MRQALKSVTKFSLILGLALALPALSAYADSHSDDDAFRAAVKAVKARNYSHALDLFETQAKAAKHDAQYNMAVLLQAGKGRPRNYPDALYWSWLALLGGIEDAADIADDMQDALTEDDVKKVRSRVAESLQARLDNGDIQAIPQFADYHLSILDEPDYSTAYIWYSIAVALNIPEMADRRDDAEDNIDDKDLARLQSEANALFDKYEFAPFNPSGKGGSNDS